MYPEARFRCNLQTIWIILQIRLDTDDIVRTLVAYNFSSGNINHFDILRHDNVRGHFPVDVYFLISRQMYGYACDKAYYQNNSGFHIEILKCYYNFLCCIQIYYLASSEFIR